MGSKMNNDTGVMLLKVMRIDMAPFRWLVDGIDRPSDAEQYTVTSVQIEEKCENKKRSRKWEVKGICEKVTVTAKRRANARHLSRQARGTALTPYMTEINPSKSPGRNRAKGISTFAWLAKLESEVVAQRFDSSHALAKPMSIFSSPG